MPNVNAQAYITRADYPELIKRANAGDPEALQKLALLASKQMGMGESLAPPLAGWLIERLEVLGRTGSPLDAFPVRRKHGPRADTDKMRRVCAMVSELKEQGIPLGGNSRGEDGAFARVADKLGLSEETVRDLYYKALHTPIQL